VVDYVKINNGAWNDPASWDIGTGWPSSSLDTATLGAFDTAIPAGTSIICGAISMTGTSSAARSRLIQDGNLSITANATLGAWNEWQMTPGAELELNGNDILLTSNITNHNRLVFVGTANDRWRVRSSVAGAGRIWRLGTKVQCHVDFRFGDFDDIGGVGGADLAQGLGENYSYTAGEFVRCEDVTFTQCGASSFGGFLHVDATFTLRRIDIREPRAGNNFSFYIADLLTATNGTGVIDVNHLTFDASSITRGLRLQSGRITALTDCVFSNTRFFINPQSGNSTGIDNSLHFNAATATWNTGITEGASGTSNNLYVLNERNNPKPFENAFTVNNAPLIELSWIEPYTDDGDLLILSPTRPLNCNHALVLDERSSSFFNALGSAMADNYSGWNNTLVGNYDPFYGSLFRTESGGSVTGTLQLYNNIVYNKTPVAGSLGFNIDTLGDDQITEMDYNCWFQIDNIYNGVTSATKTPGVTVGYGGNDIVNDPQFLDATRNAAQYDLLMGTGVGTNAAFVADMLSINGYDAVTRSQIPANASPRRPIDAYTWVRDGYAPTNPVFENAGQNGLTFGAVPFVDVAGAIAGSGLINSKALGRMRLIG